MSKFVTFNDGTAKYQFRAIFPNSATKKEIHESVKRKMLRWLNERGLTKEDFDFDNIPEFTTITSMRDGQFYEPDFGSWND